MIKPNGHWSGVPALPLVIRIWSFGFFPMHSIILSIGDELILGQTVDTNSAWIAERLMEWGVMPLYHLTVADDLPTITQAKQAAIDEINRTPTAVATPSMVTVTTALADGVSACVGTSTVATPCYITVRVQYAWSTLIAWPIVPNGGTFDRTTSIRTYY